MRVLLFGNSTWCLYNFRRSLIEELVQHGHQVSVVAPFDKTFDNRVYVGKLTELSVDFHPLPLRPRNLNPLLELWAILCLFGCLLRIRPDIVLTFTIKCNLYAGLCRRLIPFQQIANVPGLGEVFEKKSFVQRLVRLLYKYSFRGTQAAFFQNQNDLEYCLKNNLVPRKCCRLIPGSGVDLERFWVSLPPRCAKRRVFFMFGRLLSQKGYYIFLEAARLMREQVGAACEYWILGIEDKNRPDSSRLLAAIRQAESEGLVRYFPTVVDVTPILSAVDVVVLPSWYNEGVPRSLLEAMASGKAIITSNWKGCREVVEQGKNGYCVPVKDAAALTEAMLTFARMDDVKLRAMGIHSRALVEERFDERLVIDAYLTEIYGNNVISLPQERAARKRRISQSVLNEQPAVGYES